MLCCRNHHSCTARGVEELGGTAPTSPSELTAGGVKEASAGSSPRAPQQPHQPQKSPGLILGGTQEAAPSSPVEPSTAGIPASLKNPFCQKSKPLTTILFYSAPVMKPQNLRREREKKKEDTPGAHLLLQSQPSSLPSSRVSVSAVQQKGLICHPFGSLWPWG